MLETYACVYFAASAAFFCFCFFCCWKIYYAQTNRIKIDFLGKDWTTSGKTCVKQEFGSDSMAEWVKVLYLRRPWLHDYWVHPYPSHAVASLDKTFYDDYLCLVASNKQQIYWIRIPKKNAGTLEHWKVRSSCEFLQARSSQCNKKCADRPVVSVWRYTTGSSVARGAGVSIAPPPPLACRPKCRIRKNTTFLALLRLFYVLEWIKILI